MEKIINFLRKFSFWQNWQTTLENKPAGPTQITILIIIIASIVIYNTTQAIEVLLTFRKIGFPIITGVLLFVLATYATGTNLLLRRHRKALESTKEVLATWVENYASTLLKFEYLIVKYVYEIQKDGTGICYRRFKLKSLDSEVMLDEFDIGTFRSNEIAAPLFAEIQFYAYEIKDGG